MTEGIREVKFKKSDIGKTSKLRVVFGPHYFLELNSDEDGKVTFILGATHHGFKADASEVGGELENFIYEIKDRHPKNEVD